MKDILTVPEFHTIEIALMDIDADNLALARQVVDRIVESGDYPAKVTVVSVTINIVLNVVLVISFGIAGIAMASVISKYFNSITMGLLMKRVMNVYPKISSILKPLTASLVMMGLIVILPYPATILIGSVEIIAAGSFYFAFLFIIKGYDRNDIRYIRNAIFSR